MISIILPSYKSENYLDLCLYSIFNGEKNKNKNEVIVVLDGYVDQSRHIIEKYKDYSNLKVIAFENNMGFQYAVNTGVYNASSDKIFVANNDNVFPENWDVILENSFIPNSVVVIQQIEPEKSIFNFIEKDFGKFYNDFKYKEFIEFEKSIRMPSISNDGYLFPFLMSKTDFMRIGGLDLYYQSLNVVDFDFWVKCKLSKINSYRTHAIALYHFVSKGSKNQDNITDTEKNEYIAREQLAHQQFYYKWGYAVKRRSGNLDLFPDKKEIRGVKF